MRACAQSRHLDIILRIRHGCSMSQATLSVSGVVPQTPLEGSKAHSDPLLQKPVQFLASSTGLALSTSSGPAPGKMMAILLLC